MSVTSLEMVANAEADWDSEIDSLEGLSNNEKLQAKHALGEIRRMLGAKICECSIKLKRFIFGKIDKGNIRDIL